MKIRRALLRHSTYKKRSAATVARRSRRVRSLETLEKRQLLAGDLTSSDAPVLESPASFAARPVDALQLTSAAEGESEAQNDRVGGPTGFSSEGNSFEVSYDAEADTLTILADGEIDTFVLLVTVNGTGEFRNLEFDRILTTSDLGVRFEFGDEAVFPGATIESSAQPGVTQIISFPDFQLNSLVGISDSQLDITSDIRVLRFDDPSKISNDGESEFEFPSLGTPLDQFQIELRTLLRSATAELPKTSSVGQTIQIPVTFESEVFLGLGRTETVTLTIDGEVAPLPIELQEDQTNGTFEVTFDRSGTFEVIVTRTQRNPDESPIIVNTVGSIEVVEPNDLGDLLVSDQGLFGLQDFDLAAIDDLVRAETSFPQRPEVRYGLLRGRVSIASVNAGDQLDGLDSLRILVRPSVETAVDVFDNPFVFTEVVSADGSFTFNLESELSQAVGNRANIARLDPRLTAQGLSLVLIDRNGRSLDQLDISESELLAKVRRGILPSSDPFLRVLDVDLDVTDTTLSLAGNATVNTEILVFNSSLLAATLPEGAVMRVEVDFGDGSEVQGVNLPAIALSSAGRLGIAPEFFDVDTRLFSNLNFQAADRLRRHTYTTAGDFEITVTATLPGGQISRATQMVNVVPEDRLTPEVSNLSFQSKFRTQGIFSTVVTGEIRGFGDLPEPTLRLEIDGESATIDVEELTSIGGDRFRFTAEFDQPQLNLPRFVTPGADLEDQQFDARLSIFDNNGSRLDRRASFFVDRPDLISAGISGIGASRTLHFSLDSGLRPSNQPLVVEVNNVTVEVTRQPDILEPPVTRFVVGSFVAEASEDGTVSDILTKIVEDNFGGADQVPSDLEIVGLPVNDQDLLIRVFTRNDRSADTPPEQLKDQLIQEKPFSNRQLQGPFLTFQNSNLVKFASGELTLIEGAQTSGLLENVNSRGIEFVTLRTPDDAVHFPAFSNPDETTARTRLSGFAGVELVPRRSGPITLEFFDSLNDVVLASFELVVEPSSAPEALVEDLTREQFSPSPFASEAERTIELVFVRGEIVEFFGDDIRNRLDELTDAGRIAFNTVQGDSDGRTSPAHLVTVDWGDGAVESLDIQSGFDSEPAVFEHTFSPEFLRSLTLRPQLGSIDFSGVIGVTVGELDEDGDVTRTGPRNEIEYLGPTQASIEIDAGLESEVDDSIAEETDRGTTPDRQSKQIRKIVAGERAEIRIRPRISQFDSGGFFDLKIDLSDGRVFRVQRDASDVSTFEASLFRNADASGEPERVIFQNGVLRLSDPITEVPLVTFDAVDRYVLEVSQEPGLTIDGRVEPSEERFGSIEIVALPGVDVEINGDGSLSGSVFGIATGDRLATQQARYVITPIDSAVNAPPIEVLFNDQLDVRLDQVFPQDFLIPGRRLKVELFYENTGDSNAIEQEVFTRIVTPNPKADIQPITISVAGDPIQSNPLDVQITLAEETRLKANAATNDLPFRLTVSPGGGEADIMLIRDGDSLAGVFEIEGTDRTVSFQPNEGVIDLTEGFFAGQGLIAYANFGTHTLRVFSECSFGFTQIAIADVLPTVLRQPRAVADGFGNLAIDFEVVSQRGGRARLQRSGETFEQAFDSGTQEVLLPSNSSAAAPGTIEVAIEENEGINAVAEVIEVLVEEVATNVSFQTGETDGQGFLELDFDKLIDAMRRQFDAQGESEASFNVSFSDGTPPLNVDVAIHDQGIVFATVNGIPGILASDNKLQIPLTTQQDAAVNVTIDENPQRIEGNGQNLNARDAAFVQALNAIFQPDGSTTVTGSLPHGAEGPINFTTSGGASFTIEDVVGGQPFAIQQAGLQPGESLNAQLANSPPNSTVIERKQNAGGIGIQFSPIEDLEGFILIEFDLNDAIAEFASDLDPGQSAVQSFSTSVGEDVRELSVLVIREADGTLVAFQRTDTGLLTILDPRMEDLQQGFGRAIILLMEGESIKVTIADDHLCFTGEASFSNTGDADTAISGQSRIVENESGEADDEASGQVVVRQSGGAERDVDATVTSSGGTTTIGGTSIPPGQQANVQVRITPDGIQFINFDFARDQDSGGTGQVRVAIPDPNNPGENLEVETEIFFVGADQAEPEPCTDHDLFPEDVVFGGDVTLVLVDGNLTLTGDDDNNGIAVFTDDRGVVVQSIGGTTLNGSTEAIVIAAGVTSIAGDLMIPSLGDGDDFLCITDLRVIGNTDITSTPGDDIVVVNNVDFDLLADIDVGTGNDIVDLTGTTADIAIRVTLGDGDDVFHGSESRDIVSGGDGVDTINGAGDNDEITGGRGADVQRGGDGDDLFVWNNGDGPDDNFGDDGSDLFLFNGADAASDVLRVVPAADVGEGGDGTHPSPDFDLTRTSPSAFTIEVSGVENIQVDGLGGDDQIDASAIPADFFETVTLRGGGGDDRLSGTQGVDSLLGGDGNDVIIGNRGNDFGLGDGFPPLEVSAAPGDDTFIWNNGDGADNFFGDEGNDTFQFNGADGPADRINLTLGSDDGDSESNGDQGTSVDLTRVEPSAFTIETQQIERFEINGLAGDDQVDASALPADVVDVAFAGGLGDDDFFVGDLINKLFDGGEGTNRLHGKGDDANLEFAEANDGAISNVSQILLDPAASNSLTIDPDAIRRVIASDAELILSGDADDNIDIGQGWQAQAPETIDGSFHQVFRDDQLLLQVSSGRPFQNVLEPTDVNGDGQTNALDALLAINSLRRARTADVDLENSRSTEADRFFFEDVSGDGRVSSLDALIVINELNRRRANAEVSVLNEQTPVVNSDSSKRKPDDEATDHSAETTLF